MIARAKIKFDPKRWAYGGHCEIQGKHFIIPKKARIVEVDCSLVHGIIHFIEVVPETVCRRTDFTDKKSKVLFERDIVKTKYDTMPPLSIEWRDGGFYYSPAKIDDEGRLFCVCQFTTSEDEIIGNTIDDPQLTEAK